MTIELKRIEKMPDPSWDLPDRVLYARVGCAGCTNSVCIQAEGFTDGMWVRDEELVDRYAILDIVEQVPGGVTMMEGTSLASYNQCGSDTPCTKTDDIEIARLLLEDRFKTTLDLIKEGE